MKTVVLPVSTRLLEHVEGKCMIIAADSIRQPARCTRYIGPFDTEEQANMYALRKNIHGVVVRMDSP